jgi:site-specific DNA recombinase
MTNRASSLRAVPTTQPMVRCAIYTRKSTDHNLESDFNSLDAQRESAENYIRSQRHDGWVAFPDRYDDGAVSGATLERPALKRLIADIRAGRVDSVVVYKIDRLSRSLVDFTRLVEELEGYGVSVVSVTQSFNTKTSMGRLVMHMLLSFSQYERELTAERIRDKLSAARKRGKYVGGVPAFGYDVDRVAKKLVVNNGEAVLVRQIFRRFLELRSAVAVVGELNAAGHRTKEWTTLKGELKHGGRWHKNYLYRMLRNPVYIGKVKYKGEVYDGEHEPIIDNRLWNQVQESIEAPSHVRAGASRAKTPGLLRGMLRCGHCGGSMALTFTGDARQYRYYACHNATRTKYANCPVRSVSAGIIEEVVKDRLRVIFQSPEILERTQDALERIRKEEQAAIEAERRPLEEELVGVRACERQLLKNLSDDDTPFVRGELNRLGERAAALQIKIAAVEEKQDQATLLPRNAAALQREMEVFDNIWDNLFPAEQQRIVRLVMSRVALYVDRLEITMRTRGLQSVVDLIVGDHEPEDYTSITIPMHFKRRGCRKEIILPDIESHAMRSAAHRNLLTALGRAFLWKELLESGRFTSVKDLAAAVELDRSYVAKILNLTLLCPSLIESIVAGNEPSGLSVARLRQGVPARWDEQQEMLS